MRVKGHCFELGVVAWAGTLADEKQFARAFISHGAAMWPPEGDGPDLAPDAMHEGIRATGEWRL